MRKKLENCLLGATAALLLTAGLALAKTTTVHLMYNVKLASGTILQPGAYRVAVVNASNSPELAFYLNRKQVGEMPVKLVSEPAKISETEIHYDAANNSHVLTEIDLRGWNQKLMFPGTSTQ
ncbi:MAG TPA: hypothetical protein VL523_05670 [Terriglobia bacterium]|nr:hypothetical protein [Terriglobia bacterium]